YHFYSNITMHPSFGPYGPACQTAQNTSECCQTGIYDHESDLVDACLQTRNVIPHRPIPCVGRSLRLDPAHATNVALIQRGFYLHLFSVVLTLSTGRQPWRVSV